MNVKHRKIEIDTEIAAGRGAWAPEILAEDARRLATFQTTREGVPWSEIKAWMQSWGTPKELRPPKPRKL